MATTGTPSGKRRSHGAAKQAAMLSNTTTSPRSAIAIIERPANMANGKGRPGNETNEISASCRGAASAIRRWYRYPPVGVSGSPSVRSETSMRVTHVAPTMFGSNGLFGGGERYPLELARALAEHVDCRLVTFGHHEQRWTEGKGLEV